MNYRKSSRTHFNKEITFRMILGKQLVWKISVKSSVSSQNSKRKTLNDGRCQTWKNWLAEISYGSSKK